MGAIAAVAFGDGFVRTFIADALLDAKTWDLHTEIKVGGVDSACTCLGWRDHDGALPPLLVAGSASGHAELWMFHKATLGWERMATLGTAGGDYSGQGISAVAWAPTLGRPVEVVAVASGSRVVLWSLRGPIDALEIERVAVLEHDSPVWSIAWNMLGNWLAASTEAGEVCMWRPDLAGEWLLLNKITGGGGAEAVMG